MAATKKDIEWVENKLGHKIDRLMCLTEKMTKEFMEKYISLNDTMQSIEKSQTELFAAFKEQQNQDKLYPCEDCRKGHLRDEGNQQARDVQPSHQIEDSQPRAVIKTPRNVEPIKDNGGLESDEAGSCLDEAGPCLDDAVQHQAHDQQNQLKKEDENIQNQHEADTFMQALEKAALEQQNQRFDPSAEMATFTNLLKQNDLKVQYNEFIKTNKLESMKIEFVQFLSYKQLIKKAAKRTMKNYISFFKGINKHVDKTKLLTPTLLNACVQEYIRTKNLDKKVIKSAGTYALYGRSISNFWKCIFNHDLSTADKQFYRTHGKRNEKKRIPDKDAFDLIRAEYSTNKTKDGGMFSLYLAVLYQTGARVDSIRKLRYRDCQYIKDYKGLIIKVVESKQRNIDRLIELSPHVTDWFEKFKTRQEQKRLNKVNDNYIFSFKKDLSKPYSSSGTFDRWQKLLKATGLKYQIGEFRSLYVRNKQDQGISVEDIRSDLKHSSTRITNIYARDAGKIHSCKQEDFDMKFDNEGQKKEVQLKQSGKRNSDVNLEAKEVKNKQNNKQKNKQKNKKRVVKGQRKE